jgi:hypothetical protein
MALSRKKTPEEQAAAAAFKERQRRQTADWKANEASRKEEEARLKAEQREADQILNAAQREADQIQKRHEAFLASPAGRARIAFERGDHVFQCAADVMSQQAVIVQMVGSTTTKKTTDPTTILNSVCREGWELVNGSFVFVEQGQQSRDKFLASGQNVATKGMTVGYYLFRRCDENRREPIQTREGATQVTV